MKLKKHTTEALQRTGATSAESADTLWETCLCRACFSLPSSLHRHKGIKAAADSVASLLPSSPPLTNCKWTAPCPPPSPQEGSEPHGCPAGNPEAGPDLPRVGPKGLQVKSALSGSRELGLGGEVVFPEIQLPFPVTRELPARALADAGWHPGTPNLHLRGSGNRARHQTTRNRRVFHGKTCFSLQATNLQTFGT